MSYIINKTEQNNIDDEINEKEYEHFKRIKEYMDNCPVYEQKSKKWLENRMNFISASDAGCVLKCNHYENYYKFILKKFEQLPMYSYKNVYNGNKYETITTMIFEYLMDVRVLEYGFIPFYNGEYRSEIIKDKDVSFLGCSPDGVLSEYKYDWKHKSNKFGEMLEIKNPASRKINMDLNATEKDVFKDIPYYYQQVQQQLYCCDFNKCHFFQLKIEEYKDRNEFIEDTDINCPFKSKKGEFKGAVIQILPYEKFKGTDLTNPDKDFLETIYANAKFIYPPKIDMTFEEITDWKHKVQNKNYIPEYDNSMPYEYNERLLNSYRIIPGYKFHKIFYWKASYGRDQIVYKDPNWLNINYNQYKLTWDRVSFVKSNPFNELLFKKICYFYKYINRLKSMIYFNQLRKDILINVHIPNKPNMFNVVDDIIIYELDKLRTINDLNNDDNLQYLYNTLNTNREKILNSNLNINLNNKNKDNILYFSYRCIIVDSDSDTNDNSNNIINSNETNNINETENINEINEIDN